MLAKGVVKFPAGTQKRWQLIADFINQQLRLDNLRSKEECIKQYQQVGVREVRVRVGPRAVRSRCVHVGGMQPSPSIPPCLRLGASPLPYLERSLDNRAKGLAGPRG